MQHGKLKGRQNRFLVDVSDVLNTPMMWFDNEIPSWRDFAQARKKMQLTSKTN